VTFSKAEDDATFTSPILATSDGNVAKIEVESANFTASGSAMGDGDLDF
jgi:hypothetical protein